MHKLFTDFIQIGTSGATTDGRNIEAEWLTQIAANYDPAMYTALISWEHREKRYFGNYGKIHALEARELAGDKVGLFAVLAPNEYLAAMNKDGQSLFPSMEIDLDFADTGEPYLTGMAVTDEPASLGTSELRFGQQGGDKNILLVFSKIEAFKDLALSETPPSSTADTEVPERPAQDAFSKDEIGIVKRLINHFSKPGGDTTTDDGDPMSPEEKAQFEKMSADIVSLSATVKATNETIKTLGEKFNAIKPTEPDGNPTDKADDKKGDDKTDAQAFSEIKTQLESTQATVLELSEKLAKAIASPSGNTDDGGDDSGDGEDPDDYV